MTNNTTTLLIPEYNLGKLEKNVRKLNRKATKLGLPSLSYQISDNETPINTGKKNLITGEPIFLSGYEVTIDNTIPVIDGWKPIASLDHTMSNDDAVVRMFDAEMIEKGKTIPEFYRRTNGVSSCEHCGTNRRRNKTTILYSPSEDRFIQVGNSCLKDFLPSSANGMFGHLQSIYDLLNSNEYDYDPEAPELACGIYDSIETKAVFAVAAAIIRVDGFVKSSAEDGNSTRDSMDSYFFGNSHYESFRSWVESVTPTDDDRMTAEKAIHWILEENADNISDFFHNLRVIAKTEIIRSRYFGYIAGAVFSYLRTVEKENEKKAKMENALNEHLPFPLKKRVVLEDVKIVNVFAKDGFYGTTYIHKMMDKDGRELVWFSTAGSLVDDSLVELNQTIKIKGTVKSFGEWNGIKQTVLNRVALV